MAQITHELEHGLTQGQAKQAAQLALEHYLERYGSRGLSARWVSDLRAEIEVSVKGASVRASVDVLPAVLRIEVEVPLLLRPFKAVTVAKVESEARRWIAQVQSSPA